MMCGRGQAALLNFQLVKVDTAERRAHGIEIRSDKENMNTRSESAMMNQFVLMYFLV